MQDDILVYSEKLKPKVVTCYDLIVYSHYFRSDDVSDLQVSCIGYEDVSAEKKAQSSSEMKKTEILLHVVLDGEGYLNTCGHSYSLHKNDIFCLFSGAEFEYFQNKENSWKYCWVEFSGSKAKRLCELCGFSKNEPVRTLKSDAVRELFVNQVNDLIAQRNNSQYSALSFMYKLFDLLSAGVPRSEESAECIERNKDFINSVVYYIIENYARKDFSLSQISEHFHITASYLSKLFLKYVGIQISKYIIGLRLRKAAELLENKDHMVKEVASLVGYNDQYFFSKEFKKYYNVSPSVYQNNIIVKKEQK